MERLVASELQKQALWLFGVLIGVAIKEAITSFYAEVVGRSDLWRALLGTARLVLFLCVSLRFYFGAIQYFNAVYGLPAPNELRTRFGRDLAFGLFHLMIVCLWGLSSASPDRRWPMFPALLLAVLAYDVLWYVWSASDTRRTIRIRVVGNAFTAALGALAFGTTALGFMCFVNGWRVELTQSQGAICEAAAYVPVFIAIGVELRGLICGRASVEEWLAEAVQRPEARAG